MSLRTLRDIGLVVSNVHIFTDLQTVPSILEVEEVPVLGSRDRSNRQSPTLGRLSGSLTPKSFARILLSFYTYKDWWKLRRVRNMFSQ